MDISPVHSQNVQWSTPERRQLSREYKLLTGTLSTIFRRDTGSHLNTV